MKKKDTDDSSWFVVSWCSTGLEGIIPVTELEKQDTFDILSGKEPRYAASTSVNMMLLRARFNPQRFYEIYSIAAKAGITADDIRGLFDSNPQYAAELIRERGNKIYSDRPTTNQNVIS